MQVINTSRTYLFASIAEANAYGYPLAAQETAMILGDNTRYKRGAGVSDSGDGYGETFANLPWIYADSSFENAVALNATATITAAQLAARYITSTSAAATSLTLPTAALLAAQIGAQQGDVLDFTVDNTGGANTVTIVASTGLVATTPVITGGATLTVAAGFVGFFRIFFKSATAGLIFRLA